MKKTQKFNLVSLILPTIFFGLGLAILLSSFHSLYLREQAKAWPSVVGTITSINVTSGSNGPRQANTSARDVTYRYTLQNKTFSGDQEYFGFKIATSSETDGGYHKDTPVKVYYNPKQPRQSVLKPQSFRGIGLPLLLGSLFLIFAAFSLQSILIRSGARTLPYKVLRLFVKISRWNKAMGQKFNRPQ